MSELSRLRLLGNVTPELVKSWTNSLTDKSEAEIRMGLKKARDFTDFLSLPAFRELCTITPEDCGLPAPADAWTEAAANCHDTRNHAWSHPCVYKALTETGLFEMRNTAADKIRKAFDRNYEIACRTFIEGGDLNVEIPKALPPRVFVKSSPASENYQEFKKQREAMGL